MGAPNDLDRPALTKGNERTGRRQVHRHERSGGMGQLGRSPSGLAERAIEERVGWDVGQLGRGEPLGAQVLRGQVECRAAILDERALAARRHKDADSARWLPGSVNDPRRDAVPLDRPHEGTTRGVPPHCGHQADARPASPEPASRGRRRAALAEHYPAGDVRSRLELGRGCEDDVDDEVADHDDSRTMPSLRHPMGSTRCGHAVRPYAALAD